MYDTLAEAVAAPPLRPSRIHPTYTFSTTHLAAPAQLPAWIETLGPPFTVEAADAGPGFEAEQSAWDLGGVVLVHTRMPAAAMVRAAPRIRADGLDHWVFTSLVSGIVQTRTAARQARIGPMMLKVQSLGSEFRVDATACESIDLFVPRDFCRSIAGRLDAADNTALESGLGRLMAQYLQDLALRLATVTEDEVTHLLVILKAMIFACVAPNGDALEEAHAAIHSTLLEQARSLIQLRLHSPSLGPVDLCLQLGISRSRLYRLFEADGGVMHYIRRRRLLDVHAALSNPEDRRTIVQIAAEKGFYDAAEFSRAFKREFGYRPTEARRQAGAWRERPRFATVEEPATAKLAHILAHLH